MAVLPKGVAAATIPWNGSQDDDWHNVDNWDFVVVSPPFFIHRVPGDTDIALLSTPAADSVRLTDHTAPINGLNVSNRIQIDTHGFFLRVDDGGAAHTILSGGAQLKVTARADDPANPAFETDNLSVSDSARVLVTLGAVASVEGQASIRGDGTVMVLGLSELTIGTLNLASLVGGGAGDMVVDGGSRLTLSGSGPQQIGLYGVGSLTVARGATFETGTGELHIGPLGTVSLETINGVGGTLTAGGDILVDGGTLSKSDESQFSMAGNTVLTVQNGGTVQLGGDYAIADGRSVHLSGGAAFDVTGELDVGRGSGGALIIEDAGTSLSTGGPLYVGMFGGIGSLTVSQGATPFLGAVAIASLGIPDTIGLVRIEGGSTVTVFDFTVDGGGDGSSATAIITDAGTSVSQAVNASLYVGNLVPPDGPGGSAVLHLLSGATFTNNGGAGEVVIRPTGTFNVENATFHSGGDVSVEEGTLHVYAGGTVELSDGATLTNYGGNILGRGTIVLGGTTLENAGRVAPGDSVGDLILSAGHYLQTADGTLSIELPATGVAGQDYDRLFVSGTATLDGTLEVTLSGGFTPAPNDSFEVLRANGGVIGTFAVKNLPPLPPGRGWEIDYGPNFVTLHVIAQPVPGDFDGDSDVDLDDYAIFSRCLAGPEVTTPPPLCTADQFQACDLGMDGDVDEQDFGLFQSLFAPPGP
ncbi:MAG: hypothetical protein D6788_07575 [Planctomycetota bacterium]|nr:MAG: hypothetical protein D6788_07575 [Planctomycetota bacterium]